MLLIEAGSDDRGREDLAVPALAPTLQHTDVDWDYVTVPQEGMEGFKDRVRELERGCTEVYLF